MEWVVGWLVGMEWVDGMHWNAMQTLRLSQTLDPSFYMCNIQSNRSTLVRHVGHGCRRRMATYSKRKKDGMK